MTTRHAITCGATRRRRPTKTRSRTNRDDTRRNRNGPLVRIQRALGNRGVQRLLSEPTRPKLTVGPPNDRFEREADRVARDVTRGGAETGQRPTVARATAVDSTVQRMCPRCQKRHAEGKPLDCPDCEREIRRTPASPGRPDAGARTASPVRGAETGGRPLPDSVRSFFEPRFGRGFGDVRVHTGARADAAARAVNARAFTLGRDVVFRSGEYRPETSDGRRLLAHELTHTIQQDGATAAVVQRECVDGRWEFEYDGCSVPDWVSSVAGIDPDNPAGGSDTQFAIEAPTVRGGRACDRHDECYQTCGSDRAACDERMHRDMLAICNASSESQSVVERCRTWADRYFTALTHFGGSAHEERQRQVCDCQPEEPPAPSEPVETPVDPEPVPEPADDAFVGPPAPKTTTYTVKPGDTLWDIAREFAVPGGWPALYERNRDVVGDDPDLVFPGQTLEIPVPYEEQPGVSPR